MKAADSTQQALVEIEALDALVAQAVGSIQPLDQQPTSMDIHSEEEERPPFAERVARVRLRGKTSPSRRRMVAPVLKPSPGKGKVKHSNMTVQEEADYKEQIRFARQKLARNARASRKAKAGVGSPDEADL